MDHTEKAKRYRDKAEVLRQRAGAVKEANSIMALNDLARDRAGKLLLQPVSGFD